MAFPSTKLPLVSEFLINGSWVEATEDRLTEGGMTITRGRQDWGARVVASRCESAYRNPTGKYSNRLPTSVNFRRLGQGTRQRHRIRWVRATFSGSATGDWAPTDTLQTWIRNGGTFATDYAENSGVGKHIFTNVTASRNCLLTTPAGVSDVTAVINVSAVATGGTIYGSVGMGSDLNNCYLARLRFTTSATVQLEIIKRVGGVQNTVVSVLTLGAYAAGTRWSVRLQRMPWGLLRAAAWLESDNPSQTDTWHRVGMATDLADFSQFILRSQTDVTVTNVNAEVRYDNAEVNNFRFHGETTASAPAWDLSGKKVLAPFTASGILERLSAPSAPSISAMRRTTLAFPDLVEYFPLEDASGATQFASALGGRPAVGANHFGGTGTVAAAGDSTLAGSMSVAAIESGGTSLDLPIPDYVETGTFAVVLSGHIASSAANGFFVEIFHANRVTTTISIEAALNIISAAGSDDVGILWSDNELISVADLVGKWLQVEVTAVQSTGAWTVRFRDELGVVLRTMTGTSAPAYGKVISVRVTSFADVVTDKSPVGAGHVRVFNSDAVDFELLARSMSGHAGETAATRMARVAGEIGEHFELLAATDETAVVGPQPVGTAVEVMHLAAEADQGILFEPRDAVGLAYRPLSTLYDQTGLILDYDGGHLAHPFQPTEDGQRLVNDATALRDGGSEARIVVTDGYLGTDAIGEQAERLTWNVASDLQLPDIAGWRTHLGTWDEARYPQLTVNLAAPDVAADPALIGAVAAADIGDAATVTDLPTWMPPDDVAELIQGSTEWFGGGREWKITWNAIPAGAYRVGEFAGDTGDTNPKVARYWGDVLELAASVTSTATSWSVTTSPLFTAAADDFTPPIRLMCGGEEVWATGCTGASSPQTLTVQRSKNGVVKAHNPTDEREREITLLDGGYYAG